MSRNERSYQVHRFQFAHTKGAFSRKAIEKIAFFWLVDGLEEGEIGEITGLSPEVILKLCRAETQSMTWASVVGDLIATGYDVSMGNQIRSLKEKPDKPPNTQKRTSKGLWA